jgi:hypothetical protein
MEKVILEIDLENKELLDKVLDELNKHLHISSVKIHKANCIDFSSYKIDAFLEIKDPVKYQKDLRSEWDNEISR